MFRFLRRLLPRPAPRLKGLPRFPGSSAEAAETYARWDRLNGRYYFVADVRLPDGRRQELTFDSDRNIAVDADDTLFGAVIERCRIVKVPGKGEGAAYAVAPCGTILTLDELMAAVSAYLPECDVALMRCPRCGDQSEIQIRPDEIRLGYLYAAGAPHFATVFTTDVPGLLRRATAAGLEVEWRDRTWIVPSTR